MASPSVTYVFANSTTADATQVNQNFTDLINAMTDATKTFSISALTVVTLATTGNTTLGDASADSLTINASLASSIPISTTFSYDFGSSTSGLKSLYLGSDDSAARTVRLIAGTVGTSYTFTLPVNAGTSRYKLITDGSGATSWEPVYRTPSDVQNYSISAAVATSALTITVKGANGSSLSATNVMDVVFRNVTAATGTPVTRSVTSNLSVVVSSGSTLGHKDGAAQYLYVYAIDNAGTVELAVSSVAFDDGSVVSTTSEGGGGAADSIRVMYSTTARTNVPCRLIGRMLSTQTTAGTWAATMTEISLLPILEQVVAVSYTTAATTTVNSATLTAINADTLVFDTHNSTTTTSPWLWTAPMTGYYKVNVSYSYTAAATGQNYTAIMKNGSETVRLDDRTPGTNDTGRQGHGLIKLAAGDTLSIGAFQSSGGGRTIDRTFISVHKIRGVT